MIAEPPSRPHLRKRFEERRDDLIDQAAAIFAERGYHDTSMRDLLELTGFTVGRIYHYFGTKDDLLFMIQERFARPILAELEAILASEDRPAEQLRRAIRVSLEHNMARRAHRQVIRQETPTLVRGLYRQEVRALRQRYRALILELVERSGREHGLRLGDPELSSAAFRGLVDSVLVVDPPLDVDEIATRFCDALLLDTA